MAEGVTKMVGEDNFTVKSLANEVVEINTNLSDSFCKVVAGLKASKIVFYTYELKSEQSYKVFIQHWHHTNDPNDIKKELALKGYQTCNVVNIRHSQSREPLPSSL